MGLLAVLGTAGTTAIVLWTQEIARIVGPLWVLAWMGYYAWYRRRVGRLVYGSRLHHWEAEQLALQLRLALERCSRVEGP